MNSRGLSTIVNSTVRAFGAALYCKGRALAVLGQILLVALLPVSASAAPQQDANPDHRRYVPVEDPRQQARVLRALSRKLLAGGRLDAALKVLLALEALTPADRDLQIVIAQTEVGLGRYDAAIRRLKILAERQPDWPRPRVELALAYEAAGRLSDARGVLIDELGRNPPPPVRRNLEGRIRAIEDRMPFLGRFSFGVVPDSNVTGGTYNDSVQFLGLPFQVNDDAKAKSGVHADVAVGGTLRTAWRENTRLVASLDAAHSQPLTKAGNPSSNVRLALGAMARGAKWSLFTGIAVQPFVEKGDMDRRESSWFGAAGGHLAGPVALGGSLVLTQGVYAGFHDRDFDQWETKIGPSIAIGDYANLQVGGIFGARNADSDVYSYRRTGGFAGLSFVPGNGYRLLASAALVRDRYEETAFGFSRPQEDLTTVMNLRLVKGNTVIAGFSPTIGLGYSETRSTIAIYDKRGYSVELGFARPY